jgi:hypothetical protein
MAWPRHVMQSVAIPAVTHTRASGDYQPSNSQWNIGDSSILTHSIGLAPFKDVSWIQRTYLNPISLAGVKQC